MMTEAQIRHLEKYSAAFAHVCGDDRTVREYAEQYSYEPELYVNICSDLGIEPMPELTESEMTGEPFEVRRDRLFSDDITPEEYDALEFSLSEIKILAAEVSAR